MASGNLVQALTRGLDILVLLAEAGESLSLKAISDRLGLKNTTVHNLLRTLRASGFAAQLSHSQEYTLGPRLPALMARYGANKLLMRMEGMLQALAGDDPSCTYSFTQPVGGEVWCRLRLSPDHHSRMQRTPDTTFNLYSSASGLATLAFAGEEISRPLQQRHPLLEEGAHLWPRREKLDAYLAQCRRDGFALHPLRSDTQLAVAAPVRHADGSFAGTLGASRSAGEGEHFDEAPHRSMGERLAAILQDDSRSGDDHDKRN